MYLTCTIDVDYIAINEYISAHQTEVSHQLTSTSSIASDMFLYCVKPPPPLPVQASLEGFSPKTSNLPGIRRPVENAGMKKAKVGQSVASSIVLKDGKEKVAKDVKMSKKKESKKKKKNASNDEGCNNTTEVNILSFKFECEHSFYCIVFYIVAG